MSTTFQVSNVSLAERPKQETPAREVLHYYAKGEPCESIGTSKDSFVTVNDGRGGTPMHPFLYALHLAFAEHRPISISPDHVWLLIGQGFANHMRLNAESLRSRFVQHQGSLELEVRRDGFVKGSPDNDWQGCFAEFSDQIGDHIGKKQDLLVGDFSTTGPVEKACSEVVLMDSMSAYFNYTVSTRCGIPHITLEGNPEDWESIVDRAYALGEFGLEWWISELTPILRAMADASAGRKIEDMDFWRSIYKWKNGSGGPWVSGWINTLFPYVRKQWTDGSELAQNKFVSEWKEGVERGWGASGPEPADFPTSGLSNVPFIWDYYGNKIPMDFLAGFAGVSQEGLVLRPEVGWGIRERSEG